MKRIDPKSFGRATPAGEILAAIIRRQAKRDALALGAAAAVLAIAAAVAGKLEHCPAAAVLALAAYACLALGVAIAVSVEE